MYEDVSETLELITSWDAIQPVREKDPRADLLQDSQVDSKAATNDAYIAASPLGHALETSKLWTRGAEPTGR
jgi:hypothetical protein